MPGPIILSTWSFGRIANAAAWAVLSAGGAAIDAVEAGCRAVELDPSVDSVGFGGLPDRNGRVSLDGCIMTAPDRCGSAACIRQHVHPVSIARCIMERTQHVMLVGEDADRFASKMGMVSMDLLSPSARDAFTDWSRRYPEAAADFTVPWHPHHNVEEQRNRIHDTVGVLALDAMGGLAGACSTSGRAFKVPGRVGDSPIVGHGLYVHPCDGAAVATGTGERVMGICGSFLAVEQMRRGASPSEALNAVLDRVLASYAIEQDDQVAMIALRPDGQWAHAALRAGYSTAVRTTELDEQCEVVDMRCARAG